MKPRVALIISGQMRNNSLNHSVDDTTVIDSWTNNIFTDEFKSKYDYDIFISTDSISNEKAKEYFGDHLINTHVTESDTYLYNYNITKKEYKFYHNIYENINYNGYMEHICAAYQYYRMYCAYKMMKNYIKRTGLSYTYIVRLRPDSRIMQNIMTHFNILETSNIKCISEHEQLCVMVYDLYNILKLVKYYGSYVDPIDKKNIYAFLTRDIPPVYNHHVMMYAPERQFIDHIFYTIKSLNYDFSKCFLGIRYPSYNLLYRGNNSHGHVADDYIITPWNPFDNNNTIIDLIRKN
jgi:hypothetical protein